MWQLHAWKENVEQPLVQLAVLEQSGELLVRLEGGLAEPTGQRCFDFADPVDQPTMTLAESPATAEEWFELGCDHEDLGRCGEAVEAYRQALLVGGADPTISFNLANVLYRLGQKERAAE